MGIFYFDRFCTCFVKLYLLNQKITGRIVHISEIDFMMEEGDKIIQTIGTFDDDVPLNGFTDYMDMYAVWLLMLGEYEYAKEYYLNLKRILNDNSFIDDDNSAKNQFLLFIDYILNCIGCMLHEEEYFGDYDDYDLRSMSKLHSFMNMLKKGNRQYIDIMKCERTLSTERSILEFRYY